MSCILRLLPDPELQEDGADEPVALTLKGKQQKTATQTNKPQTTKGRKDSVDSIIDGNAASRQTSRRASTTPQVDEPQGDDQNNGKGKPERRQMIVLDEDQPLIAKLPQQRSKQSSPQSPQKDSKNNVTTSKQSKNNALPPSPYGTRTERLQSAVTIASGGTAQGAEMKYSAILDTTKPTASAVGVLKQLITPQVAQRNNVVALFTGYGKEYGISDEFSATVASIYESLRGAIISATEAHEEMLSVMAEEDTSLRGKVARLTAERARTSGGSGYGDLPDLADDESSLIMGDSATTPTQKRQKRLGGGAGSGGTPNPSYPAGGFSPNDYLSFNASGMRAQSASSPSRSKYSLLMARLPRNSAELEVTHLNNAARPLLPRLVENSSPSRRHSVAGGGEDGGAPSKVYLRYMRSRSPVGVTPGAATSTTKNNGLKAGLMKAVRTSPGFVAIPFPTELTEAFKDPYGFSFHLWLRSDGEMDTARSMTVLHAADQHEPNFMIRLMANTNDVATYERGQMLFTCRDGQGKYIESVFTCDTADGEWHHLGIYINTKSKSLALSLDGKNCRSRLLNTDDVAAFDDARRRMIYLGASPTDDHKAGMNTFAGFILDFQSAMNGNKLVQHYPIARNESMYEKDDTKVQKAKTNRGRSVSPPASNLSNAKKIGGGSSKTNNNNNSKNNSDEANAAEAEALLAQTAAVFTDVDCEEVMFCRTAPYFDGRGSYLNVGSLGDWGFIRTGTSIEFKMRVSNTAEPMCVIGVTDITGKHGGFGVELNTGIHYTLQRHHLSVWATDYDGKFIRGACDLTSDTFDDHWHSVSIRFSDLSAGKFKIRLDNRPVETLTASSAEIPTNFTIYSTHVTVGCLNNRGRHERFFKGSLRSLRLSHLKNEEDEPFATWPLDEGPHAKIAWDITSHGFSGSYENITGERPFEWLPVGDDDDGNDNDLIDVSKLNVVRHNHNQVSLAVVAVNTMVNPRTGRTYEVLEDVLNGATIADLEPIAVRDFNHRIKRSDNRVFRTIPEDCFRPTDSHEYLNLFKHGLARGREYPRAHLIAVLRIGDAMFTAVDLAGFTKSDKARLIVTPNHMSWSDVTNTDGSANKMNLAINSQLANVEKLLLQVGLRPQLFKRSRFLRDLEVPAKGTDMLSSILMFSCLSSVEACKLHLVQYLPPYATHDESLHTLLLTQGMKMADQHHAALMLTRAWRGKLGRNIHQLKVKLRDEAAARKSRAELLRKQFPKETTEKRVKHALLIKSTVFYYDKIMPQPLFDSSQDDVDKIKDMLTAMDFAVEIVLDPSIESLWKALRKAKEDQKKADAMLIVYFIGYGAHDVYTQPPTIPQQLSWVEEEESLARTDVLHEHHSDCLYLWKLFWSELHAIYKKEMAVYEEAMIKASKKKKAAPKSGGGKGGAAGDEVIFHPPPMPKRESTEAMKRVLFSWASELSPQVTRRTAEFSTASGGGSSPFEGLSASAKAPFGHTMSVANTTLAGANASASGIFSSFNTNSSVGGGARRLRANGGLNRTLAGTTNGGLLTPSESQSPLSPPLRGLHSQSNQQSTSRNGDEDGGTTQQIRFDEISMLGGIATNTQSHVIMYPSAEAAEPPLEPQTFVLAADSVAPFNSSNTVLLSEIKNYVVGQKPRRGEHSIFLYDCAAIPTPTMPVETGGFGGFAGASGEAIHTVYSPHQRYAMGYYFKKCFLGAAVECVRIGRHPTEPNVTLETASHYINLKLGKHAPSPALSLHTRWFGEFVGDCFLAPSLITTKEERRGKKVALASKRVLTQLVVRWNGALISEFRSVLQSSIAKLVSKNNQCELRRLSIDDTLVLTYSLNPADSNGCDYNTLTRHAVAKESLREDLERAFLEAPRLQYKLIYAHPAEIHISLLSQTFTKNTLGGVGGGHEGGGSNDPKTAAMEFVKHLEHRSHLIEEHLISGGLAKFEDGTRTLAGGRIAKASIVIRCTVTITEEDAGKLERLSRRKQSGLCDMADFVSVHVLNEKENAAYENEERMFALDEVRKQNETKLRLTREAEARRKAEEARAKLLEKKDRMLEHLRQCKASGKVSAEDIEEFFSVPLSDALCQALEALNSLANKTHAPKFASYGLANKIEKMLTEDLVPPAPLGLKPTPPTGVNIVTDARLLLNTWKLLALMAQSDSPITTPLSLQVLIVSTFGGYQTSLNAVMVKTAAQVLQQYVEGGTEAAATAVPPPFQALVVDVDNNRTLKAIAAKRSSSVFGASVVGAPTSPSRQRLSSAAAAAASSATNTHASRSDEDEHMMKVRPIFDFLMRNWPQRAFPQEFQQEVEMLIVKFAPTVTDLIRSAGVKPAPPKKKKKTASEKENAADFSPFCSPRSGNATARNAGDDDDNINSRNNNKLGGYGSSDDEAYLLDEEERRFPSDYLLAEVAARCKESWKETDRIRTEILRRLQKEGEEQTAAAADRVDSDANNHHTSSASGDAVAPKSKVTLPPLSNSSLGSASLPSAFTSTVDYEAMIGGTNPKCYRVSPPDMSAILDATNTTEAVPLSVLLSLVYATAQFDPSTNECAQDGLEYLNTKVVWARETMEVVGEAFKRNPQLDTLRKRLAANWGSYKEVQEFLLTEEERAPPPPPPPPVVEEPPKSRGGVRRR